MKNIETWQLGKKTHKNFSPLVNQSKWYTVKKPEIRKIIFNTVTAGHFSYTPRDVLTMKNKYNLCVKQTTIFFHVKGTTGVIFSDSPCKDANAWFKKVPLIKNQIIN